MFSSTISLKQTILVSLVFLVFITIFLFVHHERIHLSNSGDISLLPNSPLGQRAKIEEPLRNRLIRALPKMMQLNLSISTLQSNVKFIKTHLATDREVDISALQISNLDTIQVPPVSEKANPSKTHATSLPETIRPAPVPEKPILSKYQKGPAVTSGTARFGIDSAISRGEDRADPSPLLGEEKEEEKKGLLFCNGKQTDSEVIYWKIVPGDSTYESPITPHHGVHHDRYITFEYDGGGWNNVRMSLECLIVVAHAMGRTLVVPPQQHLYLLGKVHKDKDDKEAHDEMGFEDFFDVDLLSSHKGFHVLRMEDFLLKEGVTGGLRGRLPPGNSSEAWGDKLWHYLNQVADVKPEWSGRFIAFPKTSGDFNVSSIIGDPVVKKRYDAFGGDRIVRGTIYYDEQLQRAHHIHFPGFQKHRVLQHHYAFTFFADPAMQSFYRRFVRDYMRYKDDIQCAGTELVNMVREDARKVNPNGNGVYYALHIRRGDFQYKDVKISTPEILKNLHFPDGSPIIPGNGSLVYISTDDPDGVCVNCYAESQPCSSFQGTARRPEGCPDDPSWKAFLDAGWHIRFMRDYMPHASASGLLKTINPNMYGMLDSIVCSRAKVFAGTYFSTFTGYIHRLRGYHGLGEATFYHSRQFVMQPQLKKSVGHGFSREWRAGWTDDGGELI